MHIHYHNKLFKWLKNSFLPPFIVLVLLLVVWELIVVLFSLPPYLLPKTGFFAWPLWQIPETGSVLEALLQSFLPIVQASGLTAAAALSGFSLSLVIGMLVAFCFSEFPMIKKGGYPYAIFFQTVPIVAIVPLIITWFGTGFFSIVVISFIISLFPIITNGTTGLSKLDHNIVELFQIHQASRWQIIWKARLPNSIPYLVAGAKVSVGLAVIGAIVGEFYAGYGSQSYGLGYLILQASHQLKTPLLCALVIASTFLGFFFFISVNLIGNYLTRNWQEG